jgi:hypothetical protein
MQLVNGSWQHLIREDQRFVRNIRQTEATPKRG